MENKGLIKKLALACALGVGASNANSMPIYEYNVTPSTTSGYNTVTIQETSEEEDFLSSDLFLDNLVNLDVGDYVIDNSSQFLLNDWNYNDKLVFDIPEDISSFTGTNYSLGNSGFVQTPFTYNISQEPPKSVPISGTLPMVALGLAGLLATRRRKEE